MSHKRHLSDSIEGDLAAQPGSNPARAHQLLKEFIEESWLGESPRAAVACQIGELRDHK
jgi:hypothetical protein